MTTNHHDPACKFCDDTGWTFDYLGPDTNDPDSGEAWGDLPCENCEAGRAAGLSSGSPKP